MASGMCAEAGWTRSRSAASSAVSDARLETYRVVGSVHVDGPSVGMGTLSCAFLLSGYRQNRAPGTPSLAGAAACAVFAAWTKQVEAPIVFGQLAWLGLAYGRDAAKRYFVALAVAGLVISGAFVAAFGFMDEPQAAFKA